VTPQKGTLDLRRALPLNPLQAQAARSQISVTQTDAAFANAAAISNQSKFHPPVTVCSF